MRSILLLSLGTLLLFSPAATAQTCSNQPERCAFVSTTGSARSVLSIDPATATVTTLRSYSSSAVVRDITVAPDHRADCASPGKTCTPKLYVAVDDRIERIALNGGDPATVYAPKSGCAQTQPLAPSGVRIDREGDLLFNSGNGVWQVAGAQANTCAVQVSNTGAGAGIAFLNNGDLVVSASAQVKVGDTSIAANGVVTGVAVDPNNRILVTTGNSVHRYLSDGNPDNSWTTVSFGSTDVVNYIEARNNPAEYVYVSVSDVAGENGRLYRVWYDVAFDPPVRNTTLVATLPKVRGKFLGANGLGIHPGSWTIANLAPDLNGSYIYDFGYSRFEVTPEVTPSTCAASVTAVPDQPQVLDDLFSDSSPDLIGVATIPQSGQQGFGTRYQVASTPSGCLGVVRTRWAGYFDPAVYPQPGMARIPDTCSAGSPCAELLQTFYFSPAGPLPGDPIIINRTSTSGFVPVSVPLDNNFVFGGWGSPMGTNAPTTVNQGQTAAFKFQLYRTNGTLISDAQAAAVTTVFSIAKVPFEEHPSLFPGNSIQVPPAFVYDAKDDQFRYTLDTTPLPTGRYRAIVVSNSFEWETLDFCVNSCN